MSHKLRRQDIRRRTEEYWERYRGDYDCYIEELLGRELTWANRHPLPNGTPRLRRLDRPVHTLALTVGESFEPLLQTVCVLQPKRLVLILNKAYGTTAGRNHGDSLCRLVRKLARVPDLPDAFKPNVTCMKFDLVEVRKDTPTEAFRALRDALQKPEAQPPDGLVNAVDITGAKKSMVVGAFLYAAHSHLPITYVDFEEYHPYFGKPYGYQCKIGQIADPYEAFQLRDWERVRQLYKRYNFLRAQEMIGIVATEDEPGLGILGAMSSHLGGNRVDRKLYDSGDIARVEKLVQILEMYEAWDNGEFRQAKELADKFQPALPPDIVPWAVLELGDIWPSAADVADPRDAADKLFKAHLELKRGKTRPEDSIFGHPAWLLAYARDEMAKIKRLITKNEDYRSAFLRSAGLEEFLLKARLAMCFLRNETQLTIGKDPPVQPCSLSCADRARWFRAIADHSGADAMRDTLRGKRSLPLERGKAKLEVSDGAPELGAYWSSKALDVDEARTPDDKPVLTKLRGEAIHTHLYIPKHLAEAGRELVRSAVAEFETTWLEHYYPGTLKAAAEKSVKRPRWHRMCQVCQLDFLPSRLQD